MPIRVTLNEVLEQRGMSLYGLAEQIGIADNNVRLFKNGNAKAVRFTTLAKMCEVLECQPGDLLTYVPEVVGDDLSPAEPH